MEISFIPRPGSYINDIEIRNGDIYFGDTLKSVIVTALFSNARSNNVGGFWYQDDGEYGSKIWTLIGRKLNNETLIFLENYVKDSLAFLVEDGVVQSFTVNTSIISSQKVALSLTFIKPDATFLSEKFSILWREV